jgi:hypothetical protein
MVFDADRLKRCGFNPRTETIPVTPLAKLFCDGEKAEFTVRGLTGEEYAHCIQAAKGYSQIGEIMSGIISGAAADKVAALRKALGLTDDLPEDYARRIEFLIIGCVDPTGLDREAVIKIAAIAPIEFMWMTNAIMKLSGEGAEIEGE